MELIRLFAVPPWWQPPATRIAPDKDTAIKEHDLILRATPLYGPSSAIAYTDGSKTERESVGASAVTSKGNATARLNGQDMVHAAEIKGIPLALSQIKDDLVRELAATSRAPARTTTIFTGNQAAIQACAHPRRSSGQQILCNIAIQIENLRLAAWHIRIHWIPKTSNFVDPETQKRSEKTTVSERVKEMINELRTIPPDYFENFNSTPYINGVLSTPGNNPIISGIFKDQEQMKHGILERLG